jgi:serine/threonine protein kinase
MNLTTDRPGSPSCVLEFVGIQCALSGVEMAKLRRWWYCSGSGAGVTESLESLHSALADRYTIEREIGRGGMAIVYLAEDRRHKRRVALKVLRPELAASIGAERFLREITTAAQLTHPNILPLHDSGEADGTLYYTMPYLDGES